MCLTVSYCFILWNKLTTYGIEHYSGNSIYRFTFTYFYTSTKSWRDYIFTAVCLCVCVCVCVCLFVCPALLVNKIPAEWFIDLNTVFTKWLLIALAQTLLKLLTLGQRLRSLWRNTHNPSS